jgi:hypothetical protein
MALIFNKPIINEIKQTVNKNTKEVGSKSLNSSRLTLFKKNNLKLLYIYTMQYIYFFVN